MDITRKLLEQEIFDASCEFWSDWNKNTTGDKINDDPDGWMGWIDENNNVYVNEIDAKIGKPRRKYNHHLYMPQSPTPEEEKVYKCGDSQMMKEIERLKAELKVSKLSNNMGPSWEEVKRFCDNTGRNFYELFPYIKRNDKGILVRVCELELCEICDRNAYHKNDWHCSQGKERKE